ncbi:GNAT family N-acetyltransferase [Levilactobacillus lindianensis]|uniref:GNAT family N-acetyltransferase n=1 Tax=Levilactobacillus lindianensis TaxID=2486018 RepID=UPI0013DDA5EF|nr:GNAT family N-acetyltransferase [Levilactobacillus lindianensis]
MLIRRARRDDNFQEVAKLYLTVWRSAYAGMLSAKFLDQLSVDTWHPERGWQQTWLAFQGSQVVGVCAAGPARKAVWSGWGEVYSIYVHPSIQHRGVGQRLMTAALTDLDAKTDRLYLEVLTANRAAQTFYRRFGFKQKDSARLRVESQGHLSVVEMVRLRHS